MTIIVMLYEKNNIHAIKPMYKSTKIICNTSTLLFVTIFMITKLFNFMFPNRKINHRFHFDQ